MPSILLVGRDSDQDELSGARRNSIRNVLAWLLDPRQSHSLGDRFLNHFLLSAGVPLAGDTGDRSTTEVTREWPNFW